MKVDKGQSLDDGVYAAVLTPMHADLSCDSQELAHHCLDLMKRGCQGVVLFGTTGEGPSFSVEERVDALIEIIDYGVESRKIILGNGGSSISDTVELAKVSLLSNGPAMLVSPPSFFKDVPEEGVIAFYREIIQRVADPKLRIILYHIPKFSGVPITLRIIETLRREFPENVVGIKDSDGNLTFTKRVIDAFPAFKVFVGKEHQIIEAVDYGASGSISGLANLFPELIHSLYQQGQLANSENPKKLLAFFDSLQGYHFIAAYKAWMAKSRGDAWHAIRPPLMPLTAEEKRAFMG